MGSGSPASAHDRQSAQVWARAAVGTSEAETDEGQGWKASYGESLGADVLRFGKNAVGLNHAVEDAVPELDLTQSPKGAKD